MAVPQSHRDLRLRPFCPSKFRTTDPKRSNTKRAVQSAKMAERNRGTTEKEARDALNDILLLRRNTRLQTRARTRSDQHALVCLLLRATESYRAAHGQSLELDEVDLEAVSHFDGVACPDGQEADGGDDNLSALGHLFLGLQVEERLLTLIDETLLACGRSTPSVQPFVSAVVRLKERLVKEGKPHGTFFFVCGWWLHSTLR